MEDEGPKWDVSSYSSRSYFSCQEECFSLDCIEDIPYEMHDRDQVLNSNILNEVVGFSFISFHAHSLQGFFEEKFDRVLVEVQCENQYHDKHITQIFEEFPRVFDPFSDYMEQLCHDRYIIENFKRCYDLVA